MGYLDKIRKFAEAAKADNFQTVKCDDAKDFCESFGEQTLNYISGFVNAVADRNVNRALAHGSRLQGEEYRERMEKYEDSCFRARDNAAMAIGRMNRFSAAMGLEPFADIDTSDYGQVEQVCGEAVLEFIHDQHGGREAFDKAVVRAEKTPGGVAGLEQAMRRVYGGDDGQPAPGAGMELA